MTEHYIGIDSGGSKSEAVLLDMQNQVLTRMVYEGMNLRQMNPNTVSARLKQIIEDLTYRAGILPYHVGITVLAAAGAGDPKIVKEVEYACYGRMPERKIMVVPDAEAALAGAFNGGPGIVLISGTGSVAWGRDNQGNLHRAGGYGYILGDDGSGFWIGREALRTSLDAYYRGETSPLAAEICELWGIEVITEAVSLAYAEKSPAGKIASIAPLVFRLSDNNDETSEDILVRAAEALSLLSNKLRNAMKIEDGKICLSGSILQKNTAMKDLLTAKLGSGLTISDPLFEPAIGAVILAKERIKQP